ncbi:unnamed protein product [Microthlaspi erraticum]|uniref:TCP domain-containing protein n=1 Tax=Microthlaspi erraticum TaxID=1685480 RepID=A0A6D2K9E4_9BRAS|nr:unnamed protein product [Microthlaspi erraticum]
MLPSFITHIQSPSSHHHNPLPSLPFPTDFLDESFLISQVFLPQQDAAQIVVESPIKVCKKLENNKKNENCVEGTTSQGGGKNVPRKRMGKKRDRHSKIFTAQGPRDRRMRLSLQIARKFFDLQDMLGFDKASKTIEWLISKSKASIKQVKESVAASGGGEDYEHLQVDEKAKDESLKVSRGRTKTVDNSGRKKESREKARERARERTMKKMKLRFSGLIDTSNTLLDPHPETRKIKITGGAQVEGENQEQELSNNVNMVECQMDSVSIIEKFLGLTSESNSSSIFGDSEECYTTLSSIIASTSTAGMVTPREHKPIPTEAVDEERNLISSFSLYDYLCY